MNILQEYLLRKIPWIFVRVYLPVVLTFVVMLVWGRRHRVWGQIGECWEVNRVEGLAHKFFLYWQLSGCWNNIISFRNDKASFMDGVVDFEATFVVKHPNVNFVVKLRFNTSSHPFYLCKTKNTLRGGTFFRSLFLRDFFFWFFTVIWCYLEGAIIDCAPRTQAAFKNPALIGLKIRTYLNLCHNIACHTLHAPKTSQC